MSEPVTLPYTFPVPHDSGSSWLGMRCAVKHNTASPGDTPVYEPVNLTGATAQCMFRDSPVGGKVYCVYDSENTVAHKQVQFDLSGDANVIILSERVISAIGIDTLYFDIRVILGSGAGANAGIVIFPFKGILPINQTETR